MATRFSVSALLRAKDDGASKTIGKVEGRFSRLGNFLKDRFVLTLGDVTNALGTVWRAMKSVVDASAEQEQAVKALDAALRPLGDSAAGVSKSLQEQASALQEVSRFGDEAIIKGQALLASYIQQEDALKAASEAAVNFAAGTGRDLQAVFELLAKAAVGSTGELSRYGIILEEGIPQGEKFNAVLAKMNELFGGRAAADVDTFSGSVQQLSNAWGDALEKVGDSITKNKELLGVIKDATAALASQGFIKAVSDTLVVLKKFGEGIALILTPFNRWLDSLTAIIGPLNDFRLSLEDTVVSQTALERKAYELGITVEELKKRLADAAEETRKLNDETRGQKESQEELNDATDKGAQSHQDNAAAVNDETQAKEGAAEVNRILLDMIEDEWQEYERANEQIARHVELQREEVAQTRVQVVEHERLNETLARAPITPGAGASAGLSGSSFPVTIGGGQYSVGSTTRVTPGMGPVPRGWWNKP